MCAAVFAAALVSCAPEPAKDPPRIAANQISIFLVDASGALSAVNPFDFEGLQINDTKTLSAEVQPANATDKAVTWSSSDPAVAVIDAGGKLEAKASGNAVITARAGGAAATLSVSVAYSVTTETELRDIAQNLAGYYVLKNDITLANEWTPVSSYSTPFTGTLDGAGYSVKNLQINKPSQTGVGLIGENQGTIKNIGVELASQGITGGEVVGALVGNNRGTVSGRVSGAGTVKGLGDYTGALAGINIGGTVIGYATVAVEGQATGGGIGGLVGQANYGTVIGYATGDVTGPIYVGGLIGVVTGATVIGYARGAVAGKTSPFWGTVDIIGGLIGDLGGSIYGYARGAVSTDQSTTANIGPAGGRRDSSPSGGAGNIYYSGKSTESKVTAPTGVTPNTFGTQVSVAAGDDPGALAGKFDKLASSDWLFSAGKWPAIDFPADQSIFDSVRGDKQPIAP